MGATGWSYFVPYQDDVEKALQELRMEVFHKGEYFRMEDSFLAFDEAALPEMMPSTQDLKKLLAMSEAIDQVMREFGADTAKAEKDTAGVRRFVERAEANGMAAAMRGVQQELASRPGPQNINQLLELNAEAGTHSILDITHAGDLPDFGVTAPLRDEELVRIFGTTRPDRSAVLKVDQSGDLTDLRERWQGTHVIVYGDDGQPSEIFFTGASGD